MTTPVTDFWNKKIFLRVSVKEVALFSGSYLLQVLLYWLTIRLATGQSQWTGIVINFTYKLVLTFPFWYFFIYLLTHWSFQRKAALHLLAAPLYVGIWLATFYTTLDFLRLGRLRGSGVWWDVYIPLLLYIVQFAVFHAYDYWLTTQRQQRHQRELMEVAHTAEMNALKAQLQPHFLFNALNSISASIPQEMEPTRELVAKLGDMFRHAINITDRKEIPLNEELTFIKNCLELERERFKDRLTVDYRIADNLHNVNVPPMILQPLIENAIKHGIGKSVGGGAITVSVNKRNNKIYFEVRDTGAGLNGTDVNTIFQKGIGLSNTKQRLELLYGESLEIGPNHPKGTTVKFVIPQA